MTPLIVDDAEETSYWFTYDIYIIRGPNDWQRDYLTWESERKDADRIAQHWANMTRCPVTVIEVRHEEIQTFQPTSLTLEVDATIVEVRRIETAAYPESRIPG